MFDALRQDLVSAWRHLRRAPGFFVAAVATLAVGIGINSAAVSLLNAIVLRELPIRDPHGLIAVSGRNPQGAMRLTPIPAVAELTRPDGPLVDVCGYNAGGLFPVEANGVATQAVIGLVTGRCFETFGVAPLLGRVIGEGDAPLMSRGAMVTVIGHTFWVRAFGGNPDALGKRLKVEGVELEIVGVMPAGFGGADANGGVDFFAPYDTVSPARPDRRPAASHILGRLAPGRTLASVTAEIETLWPGVLEVAVPATMPLAERTDLRAARPRVERLPRGFSVQRDRFAPILPLIVGLTSTLLALACLNLAALVLSRLTARAHEIAVRRALGASRWRLTRQMGFETLVIGVVAAIVAVPLAYAVVASLVSFLPIPLLERPLNVEPDLRVMLFTAATGVLAGILMGAMPIWLSGWRRMTPMSERTVAGTGTVWARAMLVGQMALSVALLGGAGLLVRSVLLLHSVDPGVRTDVRIARVMPLPDAYRTLDNAAYFPALVDELRAIPGVKSVGMSRLFPRVTTEVIGQPVVFVGSPPQNAFAILDSASPGLFATVGIKLIAGRDFTWADTTATQSVTIVNERLARSLSPDGAVVGRRISVGADRLHQDVLIVGVVANATMGAPRQSTPSVFFRPSLQVGRFANYPNIAIAIEPGATNVEADVRAAVAARGVEFVQNVDTIASILSRAPSAENMSATLAATLAGLALLLAAVGVYSLHAYSVSRRTREIGVRVAVGATPATIMQMVLREGFVLVACGVLLGVPLAWLAGHSLRTLVFGVSPADPIALGVAAAAVLTTGVAAGIAPARRAGAVDPVTTLRGE